MRKVFSFVVAVCVISSAFAQIAPHYALESNALQNAKVQKQTLTASCAFPLQDEIRKGIAAKPLKGKIKKADLRKPVFHQPAALKAVVADEITIDGTLTVYKFEGWYSEPEYWLTVMDKDSTYCAFFDLYTSTLAGTYTIDSLDLDYSELLDYTEDESGKELAYKTLTMTITESDEAGITLNATATCSDGNTYKITGFKAPLPKPKKTVPLTYTNATFADGKYAFQIFAQDQFPTVSEDSIYASILISKEDDEIVGTYDTDDIYPDATLVAYLGADTTIVDVWEKFSATITEADGKYTCVADLFGTDTVLYQLTLVAEAPKPLVAKDTVDIWAENLQIVDATDLFGAALFTASNEDYSVMIGVYAESIYDTFTATDMFSSSYIIHGTDTLSILQGYVQCENWFGNDFVSGEVIASDTVQYNLLFQWIAPEAKDTVAVNFATPGIGYLYEEDGDILLYNEDSKYIVMLDIFTDSVGGSFGKSDLYTYYTGIGVISNNDTTELAVLTAEIEIIDKGNNLCTVNAGILASDTLFYQITSDFVWKKKGLDYDAEEGELNRTFTGADEVSIEAEEDYNAVYFTVESAAQSDMVGLLFFVPESDVTLPAGEYVINQTQEENTVQASPGVVMKEVWYSFYAELNEEGDVLAPLYFFESGTVKVEYNDDNLKVTIEAANSYNVPIHIVYDASLSAVSNIADPAAQPVKFLQNGQLYIRTADRLYNSTGAVVK